MTTASRPSASLYWKLVEDCLVAFYGVSRRSATWSVSSVRKRLSNAGVKSRATDLLYHSEPIDAASDIAREPFPSGPDFRERYAELKDARRHSNSLKRRSVIKSSAKKRLHLPEPSPFQETRQYVDAPKEIQSLKR